MVTRGYDGVRWSLKIGFIGSAVATSLSLFQLFLGIRTTFWWANGTFFSGEIPLISAVIGIIAGIFGLYGCAIGKKLGGVIMICTGILISIAASFNVMLFGFILFFGGIAALVEERRKNKI